MGMAIQLGPFTLTNPFVLAPMAGITDSPFRRVMRKRRSAMVFSELISANGISYSNKKSIQFFRFHEEERPVGLQVFGENHARLCQAAREVERSGADFVDLNLGCPVPKVVRRGAGSAICLDLVLLDQVLNALVHAVRIPVSIKIRTGWDANFKNAKEVIRVAAEAGVSWVSVHGRTRAQGYSGVADWDYIAELKSASPIPLIGNGDLTTPELALEKLKRSGVDAVMIGRGALRNPFIFAQAEALWRGESYSHPELQDYLQLMQEHNEFLLAHLEPRKALLHFRRFVCWYTTGFPNCHEFRKKVFQILEPDQLWNEIRTYLEESYQQADGQVPIYQREVPRKSFLMGGHG